MWSWIADISSEDSTFATSVKSMRYRSASSAVRGPDRFANALTTPTSAGTDTIWLSQYRWRPFAFGQLEASTSPSWSSPFQPVRASRYHPVFVVPTMLPAPPLLTSRSTIGNGSALGHGSAVPLSSVMDRVRLFSTEINVSRSIPLATWSSRLEVANDSCRRCNRRGDSQLPGVGGGADATLPRPHGIESRHL